MELSQYAPDLYSFFGYQANFKFRLKQDNIEIKESRIYPGDIIITRERLIEIYNEIRAKGIENYQPNIISLKYLCNFLEDWNKIYEYLSYDYSIDILAITTKVESFIGLLMNYLKKDSNFLIKVYEVIGTVYRNLADFKRVFDNYERALEIKEKNR